MNMKKIMAIAAAAYCSILAATAAHAQEVRTNTFGGQLVLTMPVETRALKGAPYSAEVVTDSTQTLADGNRIVQHSSGRVYRDGQGRVRREEDRPSGGSSISIVDPVAGVSYSLDPENRVAWKSGAPAVEEILRKVEMARVDEVKRREMEASAKAGGPVPEELKRRRDEEQRKADAEKMVAQMGGGRVGFSFMKGTSEEQHSTEALAPRTLEGVRVDGRRTTTTIAAGAIGNDMPIVTVSEEWTSPDLQVLVLTQRKDPRNGDSSYRLLNILRREPDPSLFQVPADYTVKEAGIRRLELSREER